MRKFTDCLILLIIESPVKWMLLYPIIQHFVTSPGKISSTLIFLSKSPNPLISVSSYCDTKAKPFMTRSEFEPVREKTNNLGSD